MRREYDFSNAGKNPFTQKLKGYKTLNNGVSIPAIGFGTFRAGQENGADVIGEAIRAGYRHIDTAAYYRTEGAVGQAVAASGIDRSEFFITTKVWKEDLGYDRTMAAAEDSLKTLGMDYVDLLLIHWPRPDAETPNWRELDRGSWRALEELYRAGKARAIGVSNFKPHHLENLLDVCEIAPMADQIEFHPGWIQPETTAFCQAHNIVVEAWSPMGRGRLSQEPLLLELAEKYGVSWVQICLKFAVQRDVIPLPKSANPQRMRQNLELDFTLSPEDMERILNMPQTGWSGLDPDAIAIPKDNWK